MSWTKVSERRFQRPFGESEKLLWLIGTSAHSIGKDEWHLFTTARLRFGCEDRLGIESVAALQRAWKILRFNHPSIAVVTTDGTNLTYDVPDVESLEQWADKTFIVDRSAKMVEDVLASVGPCEQMQLHVLPDINQIVLHTAHWRSDGRGMPQLLDGLLRGVNIQQPTSLRWGEEVERLAICLEDAADMVDQATPADQVRVKEMAAKLLKGSPALTVPCLGNRDTPAGTPRRCLLVLTAPQTAALVSACKTRNLTVTSAIHAAIATTNIAHATSTSQNLDYCSSIRRDLRARVKEPYSSLASAAALYTTAAIVNLPANGAWIDFAKRLTNEYRSGYDDEMFRLHRVYYRQLVADIAQAAKNGGGTARAADVDISSIGVVENMVSRKYGEEPETVTVQEIRVSVNTCSRQAAVFVFTFQDCLNLYMSYNEAYYTRNSMELFLKEVETTLVTELGISV